MELSKISSNLPPFASVIGSYSSLAEIREGWLRQKLQNYVDRPACLSTLAQFAHESSRNFLVVFAPIGAGKSTLLAKFIQEWPKKNSDIPIVFHFIRIAGPGHELQGMLWNLAEQLYEHKIIPEIPSWEIPKLRLQIRQALEQTTRKFILVIDALDQCEDAGKDLSWLPRQVAPQIKIILSTQPVLPWDKLQTYPSLENFKLPKWEMGEAQKLIAQFQENTTYTTSAEDESILFRKSAGNPLYIRIALAEYHAGKNLRDLALSLEHLFEEVLERLYSQFGQPVVQDYLGLLIASRSGLLETELHEILTTPHSKEYQSIPEESFQKAMLALQELFSKEQGLLHFLHPEFARLIRQRFGKFSMRSYHRRLAGYFQNKGFSYVRTLYELSYQRRLAEQYSKTIELLTDICFLETKTQAGMLLDLIQDFKRALGDGDASIPESTFVSDSSGTTLNRQTLQIIHCALEQNTRFLYDYPQYFFQCLWNSCYWFDAAHSASYYETPYIPKTPQTKSMTYKLMEKWRISKEKQQQPIWLQSCFPVEPHLQQPIIRRWQDHVRPITSVTISYDGKWAAAVCEEGKISLYHTPTGKFVRMFSSNTGAIRQIAFSPNGEFLASVGEDTFIRIWKFTTGDCEQVLCGHNSPVNAIAYSNDGRRLVTGSNDAIRVWDTVYGRNLFTICGDLPQIGACLVTYDNRRIVVGLQDGSIRVYILETGVLAQQFQAHTGAISDMVLSDDQSVLITSSHDATVGIWDMRTYQKRAFLQGHDDSIDSVDISADGTKVVSASKDGTVRVWDWLEGKNIYTWGNYMTHYTSCRYLPDNKHILIGDERGQTLIWNTLAIHPKLYGHQGKILCLETHPAGTYLATGAKDKQVILWSTSSPIRHMLSGHQEAVCHIAFSPSGNHLASLSCDGQILAWNVQKLQAIAHYNIPNNVIPHTKSASSFSGITQFSFDTTEDCVVFVYNAKAYRWEIGSDTLEYVPEYEESTKYPYDISFTTDFPTQQATKITWKTNTQRNSEPQEHMAIFPATFYNIKFLPNGLIAAVGIGNRLYLLQPISMDIPLS